MAVEAKAVELVGLPFAQHDDYGWGRWGRGWRRAGAFHRMGNGNGDGDGAGSAGSGGLQRIDGGRTRGNPPTAGSGHVAEALIDGYRPRFVVGLAGYLPAQGGGLA